MPKKELLKNLSFDRWQQQALNHEGNLVLRTGRQVGKSTVVAVKAYNLAMEFEGTTTLVVAAVQRQSSLLFEKIRAMFDMDNRAAIDKALTGKVFNNQKEKRNAEKAASIYIEEPTLTRLRLKNGSEIICVPTGRTGAGIRGFTVDFLIADEAARIPDEVWVAILPMMATSKKQRGTGWQILLSTPLGKRGYFYDCCQDKDFLHIHFSSEKCKRINKKYLRTQKKNLTKVQYAQEFLGDFIEDYCQFFASDLVDNATTIKNWDNSMIDDRKRYYLGVDVARYGSDQNAFVVAEMDSRDNLRIVMAKTTEKKSLTDTIGRIKNFNDSFKFRKIFIDGSGVGGGVVDSLMESFGRKVIELNNSSRAIDMDDKRKKILKEDLYSNALMMLEQGKIELIDNFMLKNSIKNITFEYTSENNLKIKGRGSHLAEAFVRACWSVKNKGLRIFVA